MAVRLFYKTSSQPYNQAVVQINNTITKKRPPNKLVAFFVLKRKELNLSLITESILYEITPSFILKNGWQGDQDRQTLAT